MTKGWLALLLVAVVSISAAQYASAGTISINVSLAQVNYTPSQRLSGSISVTYDTLIPRTAVLRAFDANGNNVSDVSLYNYTHDAGYYSYATRYFSYNLTSQGSSTWFEYPAQSFSYRPKAEGTCGGAYCFNSTTNVDNCQCPPSCTNYSST
ncbi:MAG: hypothetical protein FJY76_02640, partial [Candidatus Aenigmarchaeota archaeon]|nr:hypothetical protein [Candidatus Aenigmarchaeota archaeon]